MSKKEKVIKLTEFQTHCLSCSKCKTVDTSDTKSLINVCLVGAPLLRDDLNAEASKLQRKQNRALKVAFEDTTRTTKTKLKSVMKYVETELAF